MNTENDMDIELLRRNPAALIVKYQETIRIIGKRLIKSGLFPPSEFDDVIQSVNAAVLGRLSKMQRQYSGASLVVTYLSTIVRNECIQLTKRGKPRVATVELVRDIPAEDEFLGSQTFIDAAIHRLQTILELFHHRQPKVRLFMKLFYRIPLRESDIRTWYPACPDDACASLLGRFGRYYEKMTDRELFRLITPVLNACEEKITGPDATRKYAYGLIREILVLLNGKPTVHSFDEDSLGLLVERFFFPLSEEK